MDNSYTAVMWLVIATVVFGALIFGGSLWVYSMGNKQKARPGHSNAVLDPDADAGSSAPETREQPPA